jgi:plasmid maintenance system antidote protein VapI
MTKKPYHYKPTDKILVSIYALSRLGWSHQELSVLFGVHRNHISRYIKKGYEKLDSYNRCKLRI